MVWYPCPRCHTSYSQGAPHFAHPTLYFGTRMPCAFDTPCPVHPVPGHPPFLCTLCQKIPHPGCHMPRTPHFLAPFVFGTLYFLHLAPWAPWPQTWMALLTCPLLPNPCLPLVAPNVLGSHALTTLGVHSSTLNCPQCSESFTSGLVPLVLGILCQAV